MLDLSRIPGNLRLSLAVTGIMPLAVMTMWFQTFALDRELAEGWAPESCRALARRARALTRPDVREQLARSLRRLERDASRPAAPRICRAPVERDEIEDASYELRLLASRLTAPSQVAPRGVAQVRLLLSDGSGPLYQRRRPGELAAAARDAISALGF